MRPDQILQRIVFNGTHGVHRARLDAVVSAAAGVIDAGSAVPADIGRSMATDTTQKHGIKRIDRLLGNKHLHGEVALLYGEIARLVIGPRPVIWT